MADEQWNLPWVRARQAWQRLPKNPDGTIDWGDVRVAHLDTGYTRHEAFGAWGANDRNGTILVRLGKDYLNPARKTARDPLKKGFLLFPGHGTRSGSALSGLDDNEQFEGVAPRLPLIPYRATDSVIIGKNDARAIGRSITEVVRKNRAKIISISLGQLFSWKDIGEAVDLAYEKGVIVIAAAGQKIDQVTYPGRYRRTIGVAGVSKHGQRFSIYNKYESYARIGAWAPANRIRRGNYKKDARYGTGDGTTYSAIHVSAAAAMWLRLHGTQIQQRYGNSWERVEAFRRLLFKSQGPLPFKISRTNKAGRLNIDKLLSLPLPAKTSLEKEMDLAGDDIF